MDTEGIVIRIKTPSGDMDSSVNCLSLLNFNDLLVSASYATGLVGSQTPLTYLSHQELLS